MSIEELIVPDEEVFSTADADVMEQLSHLFERKDSHLDYVASGKTSFTESDSTDSTMQDPRFIWYANIHTSREFPDTRDILNWTEFDIFQYAVRSSPGSLFPELFGSIFDIHFRAVAPLNIDRQNLFEALECAQLRYEEPYAKNTCNSFHNALHAAETLVSAGSLLYTINRNAISIDYFSPELRYALGIASLFLDFRHPGVQPDFLKHTREPIALQYEGTSLLERMHCAETFQFLSKFKCLPRDDVQRTRLRRRQRRQEIKL